MESLLSLSFDNISSRDSSRIRKGLRQIEGLLAQICLQQPRLSPHKRARSDGLQKQQQQSSPKALRELRKDAAFREFFRLQEGFRWNVASRLIATLERLMGMGNASTTDLTILSTLDLLQGVLLLHPPSRSLFAREDYMNLLLDLLDSTVNPPRIQTQALLVLVTALLDCPANTRTFEQVDGLLTVTSLFKARATPKDVKMRTLEFLYFYLMPEMAPVRSSSAPNTAIAGERRRDGERHVRTHSGDSESEAMDVDGDAVQGVSTRSTEEKQRLLGRHLNNVAELVQDLQENSVFGTSAG